LTAVTETAKSQSPAVCPELSLSHVVACAPWHSAPLSSSETCTGYQSASVQSSSSVSVTFKIILISAPTYPATQHQQWTQALRSTTSVLLHQTRVLSNFHGNSFAVTTPLITEPSTFCWVKYGSFKTVLKTELFNAAYRI